ncbi:MAG: hypothetical protein QM703_14175 [Gemmatales bacterium]
MRTFRDFYEQLQTVEKVSSILETTKIAFGSQLVNKLFNDSDSLVSKIKKLGDDLAAGNLSLNDFVTKVTTELVNLNNRDYYKPITEKLRMQLNRIKEDETQSMVLALQFVRDFISATRQARQTGSHLFHAVVDQIHGVMPSMKAMAANYPSEKIQLIDDYLAKGIRGVQKGIFAEVGPRDKVLLDKINEQLNATKDSIKNGLATPTAMVQGLSNQLGAIVGKDNEHLKKLSELKKEYDEVDKDMPEAIPNAKIFGVIPLRKLLGYLFKDQLPKISLLKTPEKLTHTWNFALPIDADQGKTFFSIVTFRNEQKPVYLNIKIVTTTLLPKPEEVAAGKRPTAQVKMDAYLGKWNVRSMTPEPPEEVGSGPGAGGGTGTKSELSKNASFSLTLLDMIVIGFRQLRVSAEHAQGESAKPKVKPQITQVDFIGPLAFIAEFQQKMGNLGGGFKLALTPHFIELSYSLLIPPFSFGVFNMRSIYLGAGLMLPFGDKPLRFSFNFSTFKVPFELTVMAFGGRGFFRAEIDTKGGRAQKARSSLVERLLSMSA